MKNNNPYLYTGEHPIAFNEINQGDAVNAVEVAIGIARDTLQEIYAVTTPTFSNSVGKLDDLYDTLGKPLGAIYLMAYTHPNEEVRGEALKNIPVVEKFMNEMQLDEKLYRSIMNFGETNEASLLTGPALRLFEDMVRGFNKNGFALPAEQRDELKVIKDRLADLGNSFNSNIASYEDKLIVTESELKGLPDDYKEARKQEDGSYKIDLSYPSYRPFMQYSDSDSARKDLYVKFMNKASDTNLEVLSDLLSTRQDMAKLLGFSSYAAFSLGEKMAKNTETVWKFEEEIKAKAKLKAATDYKELLTEKEAYSGNKESELNSWETSYIEQKLLKRKYSVDNQLIKEYFQLENVIEGAFATCVKLFGVEFVNVVDAQVWHSDVSAYEIREQGELVGRFYLDLFPRKNKFGHAAMFPVVSGKKVGNGYQKPTAALVCNFPEATNEAPSLLTHSDVVTFFHEFGHLLHGLLTKAEFSSQSGTSVSRDFVETPSQIFENWAWEYESLKVFAKHYDTGEMLPIELHQKMVAARNVNSGNHTLQQILYGTLDMTLHDKWNEVEDISKIVYALQDEITNFKHLEGTHFEAGFGHLNGYAAGYYGYLWAKVFAEDFFGVFKEKGVFDSEAGKRYRSVILANGDSVDAADLVEEFLERKSTPDAFFKTIGL